MSFVARRRLLAQGLSLSLGLGLGLGLGMSLCVTGAGADQTAEAVAQRWLQAMQGQFPDVGAGSRITGVNLPRVGAAFYVDGRLKGTLNEPEFARRFFGIWLSPQSSDLRLRAALLGAGQGVAAP